MCGIAGIIIKQKTAFDAAEALVKMSRALKHRGPDGEGFLVVTPQKIIPSKGEFNTAYSKPDIPYLPHADFADAGNELKLAFAHRRLSIIDITESGHQPMCDINKKAWITFNGEIYNYIELREELKTRGRVFVSESDTEVVINAYLEWGQACVNRFNGMWAFCIYDTDRNICFASRDRFGVKPFYYINSTSYFVFASEQKAFISAGILHPGIREKSLHNYLVNGLIENNRENFFDGVTELWPGENLVFDLNNATVKTETYYYLGDNISLSNENTDEALLIDRINQALENAIRIRLRSDVEVGTCLSGGIDSSVIAGLIHRFKKEPVFCFTSVFRNQSINEEVYADEVARLVNARHFKTEPTAEEFIKDAGTLVYSQDAPIWNTSTYAQFRVMKLAAQNNIKVVLDGQGADELFGGYHHHFLAKWNNLVQKGKLSQAFADMRAASGSIQSPFIFYLKESLKRSLISPANPARRFLKAQFVSAHPVNTGPSYFNELNRQLVHDIYETRLKSFLKCEDRCGMWHSVESRTPFSDDIELINLMFSFNANKKIKNGVSKYLLREAAKSVLPQKIYERRDKVGFETPMQEWMMKLRPQIMQKILDAGFDFVNKKELDKSDPNNSLQNKFLFKLFVLALWKEVFKAPVILPPL